AQLTFGAAAASSPLPSPDGKHVLFARGGGIWTMSPNGIGQRQLVAHGIEPTWAPDSRRFAYVSVTALNERLAIHVARVDRKSDRRLVWGGAVNAPAWSPDGQRLAFAQGSALMVLRSGVTQD